MIFGYLVVWRFRIPESQPIFSATDVPISNEEFEALRSLVYAQTGIFLRDSKCSLLKSRLMKRLRHHGMDSFGCYHEFLKHSDPLGEELQEMINAITTNKTSFFREPHHFDCLTRRILAPACELAAARRRPSLRIWSAGCSSGEEPYSIAMTMAKSLDRLSAWDAKILATDIDTEMLEKARKGIYSRETASNLSETDLSRFFLSGKGDYADFVRVKPELQHLISFGRMNLIDEPWVLRNKFDAIFCRNVIIYFDHDVQRRLLERFAALLKPEGLFFAGHSENLFWLGELFEPIGQTCYRLRHARA